ncbi:hypothetical protein COB21_04165 [Candidatus Aerophobetes bacterium]|uniref:Uncharacterized protein n=1 Tax=Aerophobetes bacterium TaxID=2030807 RepID=A0A2A4X3E2_UNCAE|nr:MAG: hypothetical protein COB21_04165 [Candidatus Aerophobetes bacterium]
MWLLEEGDLSKLGEMQASKWLRIRILLDEKTLTQWFDLIGQVCFVNLFATKSEDALIVSPEEVLSRYTQYMEQIKAGKEVDHAYFQKKLTLHMTKDPKSCYKTALKGKSIYFAKEKAPGVRMALFGFSWDKSHREIHSNVYSKTTISWGLEFSYPQIFSGSLDTEVVYLAQEKDRPNSALFVQLKQLIRRASKPVKFIYEDQKIISSLRMDKTGGAWINNHFGLKENSLKVDL